jgi:hypothetical protein
MRLENTEFYVLGRFLRTAGIKKEWIDDIEDPEAVIGELKRRKVRADLFTFWQRYPDTEPKFPYHQEWDNWAVLTVTSYEDWFNQQIPRKTRTAIRKAAKAGVEVRVGRLNDDYIAGVTRIFNETPIRQGKKCSHYGKSFEQVREELGKDADRTDFIGAYYRGEMIGFTQQIYAGECAHPFGDLTLLAHRDKSPNSALLAKAVEVCASKGVKYVVYGFFDYGTGGGGLTEFKVRNGFQKALVPRYFVPLSLRGKLGLVLHLHRGIRRLIPKKILKPLVEMRRAWRVKRGRD